MSRHEGVTCDSCQKSNFSEKRYKCLVCDDFDLCATCYDAGFETMNHSVSHPVQCILTRADQDLYYEGETIPVGPPQSITCPFCGQMGFTEATLLDHVTAEHPSNNSDVVCPICATSPGLGSHMTDDFLGHLNAEHVTTTRNIDDSSDARRLRRASHQNRGISSVRARRSQMQFNSSGGLSSISPGVRDSMDPITELLTQLSGVRRTAASQLQQLHMQLPLDHHQVQAARQQLEKLPRRYQHENVPSGIAETNASSNVSQQSQCIIVEPSTSHGSSSSSQFLLSRYNEPELTEAEKQTADDEHADRNLFLQELLLSSLTEQISSDDNWDGITNKLFLPFNSEDKAHSQYFLNKLDNSKNPNNHSKGLPDIWRVYKPFIFTLLKTRGKAHVSSLQRCNGTSSLCGRQIDPNSEASGQSFADERLCLDRGISEQQSSSEDNPTSSRQD